MLKRLLIAAFYIFSSSSFGQSYTTLQWGLDKTATPYNFGANIGGAWRNLGTVSSLGVWQIPFSTLSATGTPSNLNFLRGDGTWSPPYGQIANVLNYGTNLDSGGSDFGAACTAALATMPLTVGGKLIIPPGSYTATTSCTFPAFSEPAVVAIEMEGAKITTSSAIRIFNRLPTDQTNAQNIVGAKFVFHGGTLMGSSTTGQVGIWLGASYTSEIIGTQVYNLDVGLDMAFSLDCRIQSVKGFHNVTAFIKIETGLGNWTSGSVFNSASNDCSISNARDYASTGETASYMLLGVDGTSIYDSISEGNIPVQDILFDDQSSPVAKTLLVKSFHEENAPTGPSSAVVVAKGTAGGTYTLDSIFTGAALTLLDSTAAGIGTWNILNTNNTGVFSPAFKITATQQNGSLFYVQNWGAGINDITDAAWWNGGTVPFNLGGPSREVAGGGIQWFCKFCVYGSHNSPTNTYNGANTFRGNILFDTDDNWNIGTVTGGGAGLKRPHQLGVGTGGIYNGLAYFTAANLPSITTCGTSPPAATAGSSNQGGNFTTGTGTPTACTVNFNTAYPANAFCTIAPANAATAAITGGYYISSSTRFGFTVTMGTGTNSASFNYACNGN